MATYSFNAPPVELSDATTRKMYSWMYQLNEYLAYTLNNLDLENMSDETSKSIQSGAGSSAKLVDMDADNKAKFEKMRQDLLKTATELSEDYNSEILRTRSEILTVVERDYVLQSEETTYRNQTASKLDQTFSDITALFTKTEEIEDGETAYRQNLETYIRFDENGIEIGKKVSDTNVPYKVTIDNESMKFWSGGNTNPVAYINYNTMYITNAIVTDTFQLGGAAFGGYFDFRMTQKGLGIRFVNA